MAKRGGGHPVYPASARAATVEAVDAHRSEDFALGDTGDGRATRRPRPSRRSSTGSATPAARG
jgi:hypothetical protein